MTNENEIPVLKENIVRNGKTILLSEQQGIKKEFEDYLNNRWLDDLEFYKKEFETYEAKLAEYEKQSKTYKHFFSIQNKAEQFETPEKVLFCCHCEEHQRRSNL
ncbi:MAG: hypothetical protein HZA00_03475 [Nitrospinae bacterium]|nr:hypothetical protein [Nitrospinota bacterium]